MNVLGRRRVLWDHLRSALWVMPTLSVVIFLVAGAALSHVPIGDDSPLRWLVFQGTPEDARQMLIVVSSTMITVTGLVFALTIIALQIASNQYSPRLLRNFMRDRGTQFVLSIFVGAFAYSTAGLHTVGVQNPDKAALMPRLAVSGSLGLGLASLGVLIYFIHHLSSSIQIDRVMSMIVRETLEVIDDLYPDQSGYQESEERCPNPPAWAVPLPSDRSGYIQEIDPDALVQAATQKDLVILFIKSVGHHVVSGTPIAWVWHRSADHLLSEPGLEEAIRDSVQVGFERTMLQDVPFGIRRLVDIGNKALSSAINDLVDYLQLGTGQIRRFGAKEPAVARSLIQLLKNAAAPRARIDVWQPPGISGWCWRKPDVRSPSRRIWKACWPTGMRFYAR